MFFYLLCEPPFSWPLSDESGSAAVVNGPWPSFVLLSQERLNKNVTGERIHQPHYVGLLKVISVHINRILILNCHWNIHVEVLGETCKHSSGRVVIRTSLVSYLMWTIVPTNWKGLLLLYIFRFAIESIPLVGLTISVIQILGFFSFAY